MELKYCDRCGNPMKVESGSNDLNDESICQDCRDNTADKACSGSGSKLHIVDSPPPRSSREDLEDGLDLFSQNTVALKKNEMAKKSGKSRKRKSPPKPLAESSPPLPTPDDSLELFSPQTLLLKKQKREARQQEHGQHPLDPNIDSVYLADPNGMGSVAPARTATRIQLSCVHCCKKLVIRPVHKASKMVCPGCSKKMHISASNRVSKSPSKRPEHDSSTVSGDTMIAELDVPGQEKHDTPASSLSGAAALSSLIKNSSNKDRVASAVTPPAPPTAQAVAEQPVRAADVAAPKAAPLDLNPPVDAADSDLMSESGVSADAESLFGADEPLVGGQLAVGLDAAGPDSEAPPSLKTTADLPTSAPESTARGRTRTRTLNLRTCLLASCVGLLLSLPFFTASYLTYLERSEETVTENLVPDPLSENLRSLGAAVRDGFKRLLGHR